MKNSILTAFFFFSLSFAHAQVIQTVAGNGTGVSSGDGGPAILAGLAGPTGVALDDSGNLYICDENRIRKVTPARGGIITTIAGTGTGGYSGDGYLGRYAEVNNPTDLVVDHHGNVYIADADNNCIRKITPGDTITTIAGTGVAGFGGDGGPASAAQFAIPEGITMDSMGNLYIADAINYRIRKIDTSGIITTIAGTGVPGYSPDGTAATTAKFNYFGGIRIDKAGNLFIIDNNRIRKISGGYLTTIAGNGTNGYSGDGGLASDAEINAEAIALDSAGDLFIAGASFCRVREVAAPGIINTIAGDSICGYSGDGGNPLLAELDGPRGVCVSNNGDVFIGTSGRIRMVTLAPLTVNAVSKEESIDIFPDPCHDVFSCTISSNITEDAQVMITNLSGARVMEFSSVTNQQVNVQLHVPPGVYFLSATISRQQFNEKIIVQ